MSAKSDPEIGYMNRMKKLWDKIHPELTFFSAKNLQNQANRVEKNRVVTETEYRIDENQNTNVVSNDTNEENSHLKSEHLTKNNTLAVSNTEVRTAENPVLEANTSINETIKDIFMQNITSINLMNFNEQNYNS